MRFKSALIALVGSGLLAGCANRGGDLEFSGKHVPPATVRIASWDLRYLGPSSHSRDEHRSPEDVAAYIAQSGAAVIALQSVGQTPGTPGRNATLDGAAAILSQQGQGDWAYQLFPSPAGSQDQLTGVAWNKSVVAKVGEDYALPVPQSEISPSDNAPLFDRPPHAVKFSTGSGHTDFVLVPIHLQSNLGPGDHIAHRVTEVRSLVEQLPSVSQALNDRDVILLGNFSMANSAETPERLMTQAGWRDLNRADTPTQLDGAPDDRIFVPADAPAFSGIGEIDVVRMPSLSGEAFRRRLSDHHMISFDLKVGDDRD